MASLLSKRAKLHEELRSIEKQVMIPVFGFCLKCDWSIDHLLFVVRSFLFHILLEEVGHCVCFLFYVDMDRVDIMFWSNWSDFVNQL